MKKTIKKEQLRNGEFQKESVPVILCATDFLSIILNNYCYVMFLQINIVTSKSCLFRCWDKIKMSKIKSNRRQLRGIIIYRLFTKYTWYKMRGNQIKC